MAYLSRRRALATKAALWGFVLCALTAALLAPVASAEPVTYTAFTITDGKLGSWQFHNARVYLTLHSDTKYVRFIQFPIDPTDPNCKKPTNPPPCTVDVNVNQTGTAAVTIVTDRKAVHATFAPNQILVSFDLGDTLPNNQQQVGRGIGFSSFSATAPGGIEPSYPLGLEDGTLHRNDILDLAFPSAELAAMPIDLQSNSVFSGRAWPCVAFPNPCAVPNALATDKGDLYLNLPYWRGPSPPENGSDTGGDSLSAGFFVVDVGEDEEDVGEDEEEGRVPFIPGRRANRTDFKHPITYYGYVTADVTLGAHHYTGAQVYLAFDADTSTAVPFSNGSSHGYINATGNAQVTIISGKHVSSADFDSGQIYVYYDVAHASVGFGSTAGKNGYPLTITDKSVTTSLAHILDGNSLVGAVSDIILHGNNAAPYSPETASLVTDLTNATTLSGPASSCQGFDPVTSYCSNLTPIGLKTNRGLFSLFESYTVDEIGDGTGIFSPNWGVFWSETRAANHD
jgi:hypothetical protein